MEQQGPGNAAAEKIITNHIIYSMTAGAIPLPLVDVTAVTVIQLDMIKQLANHYGAQYDQDSGKSLVSSLVGATLARMGASAVKAIPGVGTVIGISTQVLLSGASTYALGKIFDGHFSKRGSIFDLDVNDVKSKYEELLQKGKDVVQGLRKEKKDEDIPATIAKLKELKDAGAITDAEFEATKKKLLEKMGGR
jgi:uncharacterized protein (DUF697 family)